MRIHASMEKFLAAPLTANIEISLDRNRRCAHLVLCYTSPNTIFGSNCTSLPKRIISKCGRTDFVVCFCGESVTCFCGENIALYSDDAERQSRTPKILCVHVLSQSKLQCMHRHCKRSLFNYGHPHGCIIRIC